LRLRHVRFQKAELEQKPQAKGHPREDIMFA